MRDTAGLRDFRLHDLGHTFASHAVMNRKNLPMIGKLLGHRCIKSTARYAHLDDAHLIDAAEEIGRAIELALAGAKTTLPLEGWASMTYLPQMKTRPIPVAETQIFARAAAKIWSETELAELVDYVVHNPEAGDMIQGTGGVRKLRWGKAESGKRGGARVIYFYYHSGCPLYLLLAYAKAQATDLTPDEKKSVAGFAAIIKTAAGIAEGDA